MKGGINNEEKNYHFIIEFIIGIIFICLGCFVIDTDYYSTLFYAMGFGLAFASGVQLLKICYYEMPKNKEKLENINRENHINNVDERKVFLRMKAGSLVYQIMTSCTCLLRLYLRYFILKLGL